LDVTMHMLSNRIICNRPKFNNVLLDRQETIVYVQLHSCNTSSNKR